MSFQSGDKIIIIKEGNYFSKEGIIEKEYKPEFNKTLGHHRWVVLSMITQHILDLYSRKVIYHHLYNTNVMRN